MASSRRKFIEARRWSRHFAIQALYEWQLSQSDLQDILHDFASNERFGRANSEYFHDLLMNIVQHVEDLNRLITPHIDREMTQIDPIEKAILWLGVYELKNKADIPHKVVINEAVELAKTFGSEGSHRYINGVLDKVRIRLDQECINEISSDSN